jgi:hypothetical protein
VLEGVGDCRYVFAEYIKKKKKKNTIEVYYLPSKFNEDDTESLNLRDAGS